MDPFNEVEEDSWSQVKAIQKFINETNKITEESKIDFTNNYQELEETLEDLKQAVHISETNPEQFDLSSSDIADRKRILHKLSTTIKNLERDWNDKIHNPKKLREITTMSNRISQDDDNGPFGDENRIDREFNQYQQQEMINSQDLQLDSLHRTMQNLNQQATMMGSELEDQTYMLEDLDQEMDVVGNKLQRGMRRVRWVLENNKGGASDWCIGILVVALIILLILLIVA
ncbi:t-SNARE [Hyphopichia burtonii NRRL Y-1933]|uniref:t-SNARE affecting a late Golgi compartment protein 1 n=1 Tax=Hyphopichia burtonii NRRL Y-1933 TaxID=984485 RepID=A0A1E4RLH2_9ASCO|nr:t-SNARE [Hyphopichia burtonii NRRL Y-1933]ODV68110.1 t-SNARE [Hyphopichia burtonii NRRL Y-1933]